MPGESAARELHEDTGHQHSPGLLRHLRHQPRRAPSTAGTPGPLHQAFLTGSTAPPGPSGIPQAHGQIIDPNDRRPGDWAIVLTMSHGGYSATHRSGFAHRCRRRQAPAAADPGRYFGPH
jgi:hypothetical protein